MVNRPIRMDPVDRSSWRRTIATVEAAKMTPSIPRMVLPALFSGALLIGVLANVQAANWMVVMTEDDRFEPESLTVALGDSVTWVNEDTDPHTSTSGANCSADGDWDSDTLNQGDSFTYVTDEIETIPYHCSFHCEMGMVGTLVVTEPTPAERETWGRVKSLFRAGS